jgi:hypothetical protein
MEAVPFTYFLLELTDVFDAVQCSFNEEIRVERAASFRSKDLLSFDVEKETLNGNRRVPFFVEIEGEILDISRRDGAAPIVKIHKDVSDRTVAKAALFDD